MALLYTFKHCFICYKEDKEDSNCSNQEGAGTSAGPCFNIRGEITRRFFTLASRYLDLDPYFYKPTKTLNSKYAYCSEHVCGDCAEMVKTFCEIYQQMEYLKIQLSWRCYEIARVMKGADEKDGVHAAYRKALVEKFEKVEDKKTIIDIDDFRSEFIESTDTKRATSFPNVQLKGDDEEYPDFFPVKVKVPKKQKKSTEDTIQEKSNQETLKSKRSSTILLENLREQSTSCSSSGVSCSSNDDRSSNVKVEGRSLAEIPKRPKISLKGENNNAKSEKIDSDDSCSEEGSRAEAPVPTTSDDGTPKSTGKSYCSSSSVFDNTVIIKNDKSEILDSFSKDFSFQCQDNLLLRVGGTTSDDKPLSWEIKMKMDGDESLEAHMDSCNAVPSTSANKTFTTSRDYYKQFNYLKYACPFPRCGKMFKTMTRMVIHQKATGHNLNAVIIITSK